MGTLHRLSRPETNRDVYRPIDWHLTDQGKFIEFTSPAEVSITTEDSVGAFVKLGEVDVAGFHALILPGGTEPVIRYTRLRPDGLVEIEGPHPCYPPALVPLTSLRFEGRVVYFLKDWKSGERWELHRGGPSVDESQFGTLLNVTVS